MAYLIGTAPNQLPTNGDLGKLAFMDEVNSVSNNPWMNTDISDVKPSLLLDFANSKTLDPRITYSRASTATYYDGKTTAVAEQNLLTYSQDYTQTSWSKSAVTVSSNSTTAPDGTTTASTVTDDATSALHTIAQAVTLNGSAATLTVYAKAGTASYILLRGNDGTANRYAWFNVSTGVVGTVQTNITASITSVGNGWYRCVATLASTASTSASYYIGICNADNTTSYVGTGSTVYLWGAQLEQRSVVSSYTPTTSSPITNYIPALQTAAAGVPRFDHDPITGESKGFLVEEQRSNLALRSQEFDNSAWTKTRSSVIADTVVAPDGTLTADKIVEDSTATNTHFVQNTGAITVTNATAYTVSVFAKAGERSLLRINLQGATNAPAFYNLATGTLGSIGAGVTASISAAGNGWYRCVFTRTIDSTLANVILNIADAGEAVTYTGNGYSGLYIWGAQVEAGSFPTSYIPTTSSQVTRSADAASMTGTNFSSWFNNAEGTLFSDITANASALGAYGFVIKDSSVSSNYVQTIYGNNAAAAFTVAASGVLQAGIGVRAAYGKVAGSYSTNNFASSLNGGSVATDTSGSVPVGLDRVQLGYLDGTYGLNGTIKKLAYYPVRLSNNELQEMTE